MDSSFEPDEKRKRILNILLEIQNEIHKNPTIVSDNIFFMLEALCSLVYRWRESHGAEGWSKKVLDLPPIQQTVMEGGFQTLEPFFQKRQLGGGWSAPVVEEEEDKEEREDILQKSYTGLSNHVRGVRIQWNEIQNALGIVNPESNESTDGALGFINLLVEEIRIWILLIRPFDNESYRFFLSLSQALLDTVQGKTKEAMLTSLGLIDKNGKMMTTLSNFILNIAQLKSNKLKRELGLDISKNTKAAFSSFLLWAFSLFAPESIKYTVRNSFAHILHASEKEYDNEIPGYTELQEIFQNKDVTCDPRFTQWMKPINTLFTLRLALDLADIPTTDSDIKSVCEARLRGGNRAKTMKRNQKKNKRKTRRQ